MMKTIPCLVLALVALKTTAATVPIQTNPIPVVTLAWDASPSLDVAKYQIYMGQVPGSYDSVQSTVTKVTTFTSSLPARGVLFYFVVQAVSSNGLVSLPSNEVSYKAPVAPLPAVQNIPTILTVQNKSDANGQWADTEMYWSIEATQVDQLFRLKIQQYPPMASAKPAIKAKTRAVLPPVPGR